MANCTQLLGTSGTTHQMPCLMPNQQCQGSDCNYSALPALRSATLSGFGVSLLLMLAKTSANSIVPKNTSAVPSQWKALKGFLKYAMEMSRERNLRSVTTNVTVSDVHSQVSMNTDRIHTYLAQRLCYGTNGSKIYYELLTATCTGTVYVRWYSGRIPAWSENFFEITSGKLICPLYSRL